MTYSTHSKSAMTRKPLFEKSSNSFAAFVMPLRVTVSPRGEVIALIKTLINADACPPVNGWADLYRMLARRDASDETIMQARMLWAQFKDQPATSPGQNTREDEL